MPKNQHPEDVKARVRKTGVSFSELGRRSGVSGDTIRKGLYVPCPKGNRVVSAYLGCPLSDLWPEWYDAHGNRLIRTKVTSARPPAHRQKRKAA